LDRRDFIKICCCAGIAGIAGFTFFSKRASINDIEPVPKLKGHDDILSYLEVSVVDFCNLNCRYCSHFSSIADKISYDVALFEQNLDHLSKSGLKNIDTIKLVGGEPLLHPQINDFVVISRKYFPKSKIFIITNAVLVNSMDEKFWKTLADNNIYLQFSIYDIKIQWHEILSKIKKYKIQSNISDKIVKNIDEYILRYFCNFNLDLTGSQEDFKRCEHCITNCTILQDGKIYKCPLISNVKYFNKKFKQNIEVSQNDYREVSKIKNPKEFLNWLNQPPAFCKYCGEPYWVKWETSNKHLISEWASCKSDKT